MLSLEIMKAENRSPPRMDFIDNKNLSHSSRKGDELCDSLQGSSSPNDFINSIKQFNLKYYTLKILIPKYIQHRGGRTQNLLKDKPKLELQT